MMSRFWERVKGLGNYLLSLICLIFNPMVHDGPIECRLDKPRNYHGHQRALRLDEFGEHDPEKACLGLDPRVQFGFPE